LLIAQFDVSVDNTGRILESNRTSEFAADTRPYFASHTPSEIQNKSLLTLNESTLFQQTANFITPYTSGDFLWHNDSFNSDWMNALLGMTLNSTLLIDPAAPVPNASFIGPIVENLCTQLFTILLGLNTHVFSLSSTTLTAQAIYADTRLFVSPLMFRLSMVVLSFQLFVAILYYSNRPKRFLPRMPTSIASILAFVAASRAVEDFNRTVGLDSEGENVKERRYGYGRFVGTDGRTKVGIERQRFVVPLEVKNPHVQRRKWWTKVKKDDECEVKIWI